jgi:hypothetical protein
MSVGKWKIWMTGATAQIDAALVHLRVGIERTRSLLIFTVISQTRSEPQKLAFYEVL